MRFGSDIFLFGLPPASYPCVSAFQRGIARAELASEGTLALVR